MVNKHQIYQAHFNSVRNNQIGENDGISPEVAADLGFETIDRVIEIARSVGEAAATQAEPELTGRALAQYETEKMRALHPASVDTLQSRLIAHQQERYRNL